MHLHFDPVVAVPARNEAERLPLLLRALNAQESWSGDVDRLPVVLVLNNTTDASLSLVEHLAPAFERLDIQIIDTTFPYSEAHVGSARRLAMETASLKLGAEGVILTTDADAVPSADWVRSNISAIEAGADLVGGRIIGDPQEEAVLGEGFRHRAGKYATYAALCDHLASVLDPITHDPWPRHQDHTGGSLAVRASVYRKVGGMPALPFREDIGFVGQVLRAGYRLVHPMDVSVVVSARTDGRAPGGMADCVRTWVEDEKAGRPILVEDPTGIEKRLIDGRTIRNQLHLAPQAVDRQLQATTADLDVVGTIPVDVAIERITLRLAQLTGTLNAA